MPVIGCVKEAEKREVTVGARGKRYLYIWKDFVSSIDYTNVDKVTQEKKKKKKMFQRIEVYAN